MRAAMLGSEATGDTFILPSDVYNLAKKRAEELYQKHKIDAVSVQMWAEENPDSVFFFQQHESIDLTEAPWPVCTYTLGIQTDWQLQVMAKYGDRSAVLFDATFGTNTPRVKFLMTHTYCNSCFARPCTLSLFLQQAYLSLCLFQLFKEITVPCSTPCTPSWCLMSGTTEYLLHT
jgi:hypothetical protein